MAPACLLLKLRTRVQQKEFVFMSLMLRSSVRWILATALHLKVSPPVFHTRSRCRTCSCGSYNSLPACSNPGGCGQHQACSLASSCHQRGRQTAAACHTDPITPPGRAKLCQITAFHSVPDVSLQTHNRRWPQAADTMERRLLPSVAHLNQRLPLTPLQLHKASKHHGCHRDSMMGPPAHIIFCQCGDLFRVNTPCWSVT